MKRVAVVLLLAIPACRGGREPDAYGNFEATEVVVSAETSGRITEFNPAEGMPLSRGAIVAVIDTTELALERQQAQAQRAATRSRAGEASAQMGVLVAQQEVARRTYERTQRLHAQQAATAQQLDQAERDLRTLTAQIGAVRAQGRSVSLDAISADARVSQIAERISRGTVTNPVNGTVLTTYARAGEMIQAGQPLYRIADLDTLTLRAYVSGGQLASIRLGQQVAVSIDRGQSGVRSMPGTVTWISPTAEFTPTPIQTRDDRADLVYAVKISVANADGVLRIGMPADVTLEPVPDPASR